MPQDLRTRGHHAAFPEERSAFSLHAFQSREDLRDAHFGNVPVVPAVFAVLGFIFPLINAFGYQ